MHESAFGTSRHFAAAQQSVAFGAKRTSNRSWSRIFEYADYKIRMMKLQMRVGGMFWCAAPPPAAWIAMPVEAPPSEMPVVAAAIEMLVAAAAVAVILPPAPTPSTNANGVMLPLVVAAVEKATLWACVGSLTPWLWLGSLTP